MFQRVFANSELTSSELINLADHPVWRTIYGQALRNAERLKCRQKLNRVHAKTFSLKLNANTFVRNP